MGVRMRVGDRTGAFVGAVFLLVGLVALSGAAYWSLRTREFIRTAAKAQGLVIDLVPHSGDNGTTYAPTVRFTDKDGRERTFTSSTSSSPPSHREGDAVQVLYDPARDDKAEIDAFWDLWLGPLVVGIFGLVFPLVGAAVLLQGVRAWVRARRLREGGLRVQATFDGIESLPGAGYVILAKATDARGIPRVFRGGPVARDPGQMMLGRSSVEVIVDPDDWGSYEMDLSFLKT